MNPSYRPNTQVNTLKLVLDIFLMVPGGLRGCFREGLFMFRFFWLPQREKKTSATTKQKDSAPQTRPIFCTDVGCVNMLEV